jgi:hypothetical protein
VDALLCPRGFHGDAPEPARRPPGCGNREMCPGHLRIRLPSDAAIARMRGWLNRPERQAPVECSSLDAVRLATDENAWKGVALFHPTGRGARDGQLGPRRVGREIAPGRSVGCSALASFRIALMPWRCGDYGAGSHRTDFACFGAVFVEADSSTRVLFRISQGAEDDTGWVEEHHESRGAGAAGPKRRAAWFLSGGRPLRSPAPQEGEARRVDSWTITVSAEILGLPRVVPPLLPNVP